MSKLTGIPVQTIRVWETRHTAVQPARDAGNVRLYRRSDIERLSLIKAAVDAGHAISTVAPLTDRQIRARFKSARRALPCVGVRNSAGLGAESGMAHTL